MPLIRRWITLVGGNTFAECRQFNVVREKEQCLVSLDTNDGEPGPSPLRLVYYVTRANAQDQRRINPLQLGSSLDFAKRPLNRVGQN